MTPAGTRIPVYGIIPAAGLSRRMGVPKQSLPYGGSTLTAHTARAVLSANADAVVVVTRTELVDAIHLPRDDRLLLAINDEPSSQMIDSIRLGLDLLHDVFDLSANAGILVIPADMPAVGPDAYRDCIDAFHETPTNIIMATYHGKRGHPILFPATLRQTIGELGGGLNELPCRCADIVREIVVNDVSTVRDVDTPADYDKLDT